MNVDDHKYLETLDDELKSAKNDFVNLVQGDVVEMKTEIDAPGRYFLDDADVEDLQTSLDDILDVVPNALTSLSFDEANEVFGLVGEDSVAGEALDTANKLAEKQADARWMLNRIMNFINTEKLDELAVKFDSSRLSVSTYLVFPAAVYNQVVGLGVDDSYIDFDPEADETFTLRISDHEPGGKMGDYGRVDYDSNALMIDANTL